MMRHISDIASPHVSRSGELSPPPGSSFSPASPTVAQSSHGLCGDLWATQMDTAPSAAVTSHPGSPPSTGGLDPGWQPSTGEPLPYSLSVTGEPPYLALSTNGTPVNMNCTKGEQPKKFQVHLVCLWPPVAPPPKASLPFSPWRPGDAYRWFLNGHARKPYILRGLFFLLLANENIRLILQVQL